MASFCRRVKAEQSSPGMLVIDTAFWIKFFVDAGIPSVEATAYAIKFTDNRIQKTMLLDLNKDYLNDMGIVCLGDIIAILKHAKTFHEKMIRDKTLEKIDGPQETIKVATIAAATRQPAVPSMSTPAATAALSRGQAALGDRPRTTVAAVGVPASTGVTSAVPLSAATAESRSLPVRSSASASPRSVARGASTAQLLALGALDEENELEDEMPPPASHPRRSVLLPRARPLSAGTERAAVKKQPGVRAPTSALQDACKQSEKATSAAAKLNQVTVSPESQRTIFSRLGATGDGGAVREPKVGVTGVSSTVALSRQSNAASETVKLKRAAPLAAAGGKGKDTDGKADRDVALVVTKRVSTHRSLASDQDLSADRPPPPKRSKLTGLEDLEITTVRSQKRLSSRTVVATNTKCSGRMAADTDLGRNDVKQRLGLPLNDEQSPRSAAGGSRAHTADKATVARNSRLSQSTSSSNSLALRRIGSISSSSSSSILQRVGKTSDVSTLKQATVAVNKDSGKRVFAVGRKDASMPSRVSQKNETRGSVFSRLGGF